MDFAGKQYYKLSRIDLSLIGLWPYNCSCLSQIYRIFCSLMLKYSIVVQLCVFYTTPVDLKKFFKINANVLINLLGIVKYDTFYIKLGKIKTIIDGIQQDWNGLHNDEEFKIMQKCANKGKMITMFLRFTFYLSAIIAVLLQHALIILDFIIPENEFFLREPIIQAEYFIDQEKYQFLILLHSDTTIAMLFVTLVSTEAVTVTFMEHACGLYDVASYRIQCAIDQCTLSNFVSTKKRTPYHGIIDGIKMHRRAIQLVDFFQSAFTVCYSLIIIIGVATTSVNLCRLSQAMKLMNDVEELLFTVMCAFCNYGYMFLTNCMVQELIDHGTTIFTKTVLFKFKVCTI